MTTTTLTHVAADDGMALLLDPILGEIECGYAHIRHLLATAPGLPARLECGQATLITEL